MFKPGRSSAWWPTRPRIFRWRQSRSGTCTTWSESRNKGMWSGKRVSVVLMTYAERDSIRRVIESFFATGLVDEVLVVDNNAQAGTVEEVRKTRARRVHEPRPGYGPA